MFVRARVELMTLWFLLPVIGRIVIADVLPLFVATLALDASPL